MTTTSSTRIDKAPRLAALARATLVMAATLLLQNPSFTAEISPKLLRLYQPGIHLSSGGHSLPYRLMPPKSLRSGARYPLVLFLHGAGERGQDNEMQLVHAAADFARDDRREQYPAFVLFPQCPEESRWVEAPWDLPSGRGQFPAEPSVPMRLVLELVDKLIDEKPIDPARVYITGLSMGGQGSWYAAVARPKRFAALLQVCGGGDPSWANRYAGIPIWAFHGQEDEVVPISRGREMIIALTEAGHHPELRYVEYPGVKHDSWTRTFQRDDVHAWLFSQRRE